MITLKFQTMQESQAMTLGPAAGFRIAGNFMRQLPDERVVAEYVKHQWRIGDRHFSRYDCLDRRLIHFSDVEGAATRSFGPFQELFVADGTSAEHSSNFNPSLIESGVAALDRLPGGGIERGTSTLLTGPPGSGKSTIALQYAVAAAARGDHAASFIFDETKAALLARSKGIGLELREGSGRGAINLRQIDPAEISPGEFAHAVRRSVEVDNARVVIIDSLNGYLKAMAQDNYLTAQLHELLSYMSNKGVTTFMVVAQHGMFGSQMQRRSMPATSPTRSSRCATSSIAAASGDPTKIV